MKLFALLAVAREVALEIEQAKADGVVTVGEAIDIASEAAKTTAKAFDVYDAPLGDLGADAAEEAGMIAKVAVNDAGTIARHRRRA